MNPIFPYILLLLSLAGTFTKYVYIEEDNSWKDALDYCCEHYTDLAPVNNEHDIRKLQELSVVTEEKKAWEEAVEYCREHHNDLASVASETEMMLIQKELSKHNTTEHVWIGLRFLSRDWLWVDGEELDYEAWVEGGKPLCPHPKMKCAALQVTEGSLGVWEAHDCEERRNFICY
ncbi:unnamed protein product [Oreochromis niloticus]|nr:unnamed protein product [Mustela putorius furo]